MDPNLFRTTTRNSSSSVPADDDEESLDLDKKLRVNPRSSPPDANISSVGAGIDHGASSGSGVTQGPGNGNQQESDFPDALNQRTHRALSISSVETTDLMDHRKHQRASTFTTRPRPGIRSTETFPSSSARLAGSSASSVANARPHGKSTSTSEGASTSKEPKTGYTGDTPPVNDSENSFTVGRASTLPPVAKSSLSNISSGTPAPPAAVVPSPSSASPISSIPLNSSTSQQPTTKLNNPFIARRTSISSFNPPANRPGSSRRRLSFTSPVAPGQPRSASPPSSSKVEGFFPMRKSTNDNKSKQNSTCDPPYSGPTSPLLKDTQSNTYRSISPNTEDRSAVPRQDDTEPNIVPVVSSSFNDDPLAHILRRKSFTSSVNDEHLLGSEPISRRTSQASSLQDVCLPIDPQIGGMSSPDGRPVFDVSYLEDFANNERRELELLQASVPLEPSVITNHPAYATALRASTSGVPADNISSARFRPYRVVPWANTSNKLNNATFMSVSSNASGLDGAGIGRRSGADDGLTNFRSRRGKNKYKDPYFTDNPHHKHKGPPLRFTYFREDMEATIHSPSISGLLQDGQTFDDLFNLTSSAPSPSQTNPNNSVAPSGGHQTPDAAHMTPQHSNHATGGAGTSTPIGTVGPAAVDAAFSAAANAARHVAAMERNHSRVSSPVTPAGLTAHPIQPSPLNSSFLATTPNAGHQYSASLGGASSLSPGTDGVPSPRVPQNVPSHVDHAFHHQVSSTVSVAAAAAAAAMANTMSQNNAQQVQQQQQLIQQFDPSPFWLDVMNPTEDEMKVLSKAFGIHPLTTEDIFLNEPREKVELFRNYYLVCFRSFDINDERSKRSKASRSSEERSATGMAGIDNSGSTLGRKKSVSSLATGKDLGSGSRRHHTHHHHQQKHLKHHGASRHKSRSKESELTPLNMYIIVFHEGVLTFHFAPTPHPMNVRRRIRLLRDYITLSSDWISYALIDDITDGFAPMIEAIEDEVNHIEDEILSMHTEWSDDSSSGSDSDDGHRHGYDSSCSEKSNFQDTSDSEAERAARRSEKQRRKQAVERFTAQMIAEERASILSDEEGDLESRFSGFEEPNHMFHGESSSRAQESSKNHHSKGKASHSSFQSRLRAKINERNYRGSTVEGPNGGILGTQEGSRDYVYHRSNYDPEDTVNDYTSQIGESTLGYMQKDSSHSTDNGSSSTKTPHEEAYESIPGALRSHPPQQHIMVDDDDDDYDDDDGSRTALLGRTKSGYAASVNSSQSSGAQSYRSRKSRKSVRVSRKSSRAGSSTSGSSSMSSSSWSSTASGRWKEKGDMLRRIGECRKRIMSVLRLLGSKADVIKGFSKRCNEQWEVAPRYEIGLYLGDIQDHIVTMVQSLNHYEKLLARSHSNYLAQINIDMTRVNNDMNDVLSKITVLGTIVLPMNIVTGLWGMNVIVPGQNVESLTWFWSITGTLFLFGCISFFIARRVYGIA